MSAQQTIILLSLNWSEQKYHLTPSETSQQIPHVILYNIMIIYYIIVVYNIIRVTVYIVYEIELEFFLSLIDPTTAVRQTCGRSHITFPEQG